MTLTARQIINKEYEGGKNFMTPHVTECEKINLYFAYEISQGEGFDHERIYGVSVVEYDPLTSATKRRTDLSGCLHGMCSVRRHIAQLKEVSPERTLGGS